MKKYDFSSKLLVTSLSVCLLLCSVFMAGCSVRDVVQKVVTGLQVVKNGIATTQALTPTLNTINPELGTIVTTVTGLAGPATDGLITIGNAYLATPAGDKYQELLNGVDALTQSIDKNVLAAAKITNPASQAAVLASLTVLSVGAHGVLGLLEQKATSAQLKAMPVIAARVNFEDIKKLVNRDYVRGELAKTYGPDADEIMSLAGF